MSPANSGRGPNTPGEFARAIRTLCHHAQHDLSHVSQRQEIVRRRSGVQRLQALSHWINFPHAHVNFICAFCAFLWQDSRHENISLILLLALVSLGLVAQEKESKTQPKEVVLSKDSQSDKYGEVAFNHENHSIKKYSIDGQSVLTCVECHHTDQPAANLKAPLKTSERAVVLTTESLAAADAKAREELSRVSLASW